MWTETEEQVLEQLPEQGPVTALFLVRYRWWAIPLAVVHMAWHRFTLRRSEGLAFWKLLGCGHGSFFSLRPDFERWGLVGVWRSAADLRRFIRRGALMRAWQRVTTERWVVVLEPLAAKGEWSGHQPFVPGTPGKGYRGPVAVLTRATLRGSRALAFWRAVPDVARRMAEAPGRVMSVGIGEAPLVLQSTFSVWRDRDAMVDFAYRSTEHREAMRRTRAERWYREDMFARFRPLCSLGTWKGQDPLAAFTLPYRPDS